MADHAERVESALYQLVETFLPGNEYEDDSDTEARQDEHVQRAQDIIARFSTQAELVEDPQHLGDLIKQQLIRYHPTTDQAKRFGSLQTKLLSQTVLSKKWGVLKFLLELSNPPDSAPGTPEPALLPPISPTEEQENNSEFAKAFSYQGLHRLPVRETPQTSRQTSFNEQSLDLVGMRPKAELLAIHGQVNEPSEQALLSTMPFTLLGLSSHQLPFKSTTHAKYTLSLPPTLPLPVVSLLHNLAEPSLLYRSLDDYVQSDDSTVSGLVGQSLRSAIGTELRGYVELVGALESQIRRAIASAERGDSFSNSGVTLKRCMIWTREATMGLRLMSQIVEKCTGQKGGQLISTIHAFASDHGDPFVRCFAERVLTVVTRPFYDMLRHWIYEGELMDPFVEFFVTEEAPGDEGTASGVSIKPGATSVWQDKYHFHSLQVPTIISEGFAKKVFLIGKSLNFIRHSCGENDWVDSYSKSTSKELRYGDTAKLEMNIDEAYKTTMKRLIDLMGNKFKLFEHLMALKKFLLLGQGDFIALLMESLADNLDRPANTLYRHNLTAQLEHAIRGSNAQFENPDMLARLDARMLELSHGEVGWDVFTLEYKVEAPVDVVVTQYGSKQYLKVFNFLWRIKRVEYALSTCWRKSMTGARGVLRQVDDHVGEDWKRARCVVAEMVHFVNQLQYYILFEVIEASWKDLQAQITKPDVTLDDLISAHTSYLRNITHKGLLGVTATRGSKKRPSSDSDESFLQQLHELLKLMLHYKDAVDGLYGHSVAEFTRRQERDAKITTRTEEGKWGINEAEEGMDTSHSDGYTDQELHNLRGRLKQLHADFSRRVVQLLADLAWQQDADLRLLGVLLSFNEYYPAYHRKRVRDRSEPGRSATMTGNRTVVQGQGQGEKAVRTEKEKETTRGDRESRETRNKGKGKERDESIGSGGFER
ncbi:Spc98 family-domain-containing protein [Pyronema omphalodes]|nr:Spc98 family-domain-containing protein [Pyronema omphalodes]